MIFTDLAAGDHVFLDANTLTYHFEPQPVLGPPCNQLMQRIENQEIQGFTSTHVLTEMAHRMMTIEASALFTWPFPGIAYRLQQHPAEVKKLSAFHQALAAVLKSNIQVFMISPALVLAGADVSRQTGLLSNDALFVAVMQANGLDKIASNDRDFDRVPGLTRYAPV